MAEGFVWLMMLYAAAGILFAVPFVSYGVLQVDGAAKGSGVGFRLLILPGVAAFWPLFLARWMRGPK